MKILSKDQPLDGSYGFEEIMAAIGSDPMNQDTPPEPEPDLPPEPEPDLPPEPEPDLPPEPVIEKPPADPTPKQTVKETEPDKPEIDQTGKGDYPSQSGFPLTRKQKRKAYRGLESHLKELGLPIPKGVIKEIAELILGASIYPQPLLAVAMSIAFIGSLSGRKYASETDLRTNFNFALLARSGAGKNEPIRQIKKIANLAGVNSFMGASRIASGAAVLSMLDAYRSRCVILDEFGLFLKSCTKKGADTNRRDILQNFLELYSCAGSIFNGVAYADTKSRPTKPIYYPHLCLAGISTPFHFWGALEPGHLIDGTASRLMVFDAGEVKPEPQEVFNPINQIPSTLKTRLKEIASGVESGQPTAELSGFKNLPPEEGMEEVEPQCQVVYYADEELKKEIHLKRLEYDAKGIDEITDNLYSRVIENSIKLALVHAISRDSRQDRTVINPAKKEGSFTKNVLVMTQEDWTFGLKYSEFSTNHILEKTQEVESSGKEKTAIQVLRFIQSGRDITRSDLTKKFCKHDEFTTGDLTEALNRFEESEQIKKEFKYVNNSFKKSQIYNPVMFSS